MECLICNSKMDYYFSKSYNLEPYKKIMQDIGKINYYKCTSCGFTISKTHCSLDKPAWTRLNSDFHHSLENNKFCVNQPPYLAQATMLKVLIGNEIIDRNSILDYAGGYGTLSKVYKKYFNLDLPVFDPYVQDDNFVNYVKKEDLTVYNTVLNSALFEHLMTRKSFDDINALVHPDKGAMVIHSVICETIPNDPNWFYLAPPVHTTFHTNKSMNILMQQWGYKASIYCLAAKSWILLKQSSKVVETKIEEINREFQSEYLIYKNGFVDYWKGF